MGLLQKTKFYLCGAIEGDKDSSLWREDVSRQLAVMGITSFNPLHKPFISSTDEDNDFKKRLAELKTAKDYDTITQLMKKIRAEDLALVDRSDAIFFYLDNKIKTCGSYEEVFWGVRMKKPIFMVCRGGKSSCPLWMFGAIPHEYIFGKISDAIKMIQDIDSGAIPYDIDRWRLLDLKYR